MNNEQRTRFISKIEEDYPPSGVRFDPCYVGKKTTATNLVLEGGAMRGQFTAGVTDYFLQRDLFCERVIGVSAGALVGFNYVAGLIGRSSYLNIKYAPDWRYLSLLSFIRTGNVYGREMSFDAIWYSCDPFPNDAFNNSPMKLVSVASNIETARADYRSFDDVEESIPYIIASSSIPMVSQIVEVDGKKLLDGGTCDCVPIRYSMDTGAKKHIVVLTQDASFVDRPNKLMPLLHQLYGDYPLYVDRLAGQYAEHNRVYHALETMHEAGEIFLIRPDKPIAIDSLEHDQEKLLELYEDGVAVAAKNYDALMDYLTKPTE